MAEDRFGYDMWTFLFPSARADAPYWPGRRCLAVVDALTWPLSWVWVANHAPWPTGIALRAMRQGDADAAQRHWQQCLPELPRIGGSHAQRSVVELTHQAGRLPPAQSAVPLPTVS
jgi:hypothetical protein